MATQNTSVALRAPASAPPAHRGYGKHSAPDQRPPRQDDFLLLPERERCIAGYVDRLPEGAAMDIKSLAKSLPLYGQMAVGTALKALAVAGHLRRVQCRIEVDNQNRWVTRTFWSRTARDNEWWTTHLTAEDDQAPQEAAETRPAPHWVPCAPDEAAAPADAPSVPAEAAESSPAPCVPQQRIPDRAPDGPSPAYLALAHLGRAEPRLALSAADCRALEAPAAEWFARGVDTAYLTHALTAGLPARVDSPVGLVRRRLNDKLPPHLPAASTTPGSSGRRLLAQDLCERVGLRTVDGGDQSAVRSKNPRHLGEQRYGDGEAENERGDDEVDGRAAEGQGPVAGYLDNRSTAVVPPQGHRAHVATEDAAARESGAVEMHGTPVAGTEVEDCPRNPVAGDGRSSQVQGDLLVQPLIDKVETCQPELAEFPYFARGQSVDRAGDVDAVHEAEPRTPLELQNPGCGSKSPLPHQEAA